MSKVYNRGDHVTLEKKKLKNRIDPLIEEKNWFSIFLPHELLI